MSAVTRFYIINNILTLVMIGTALLIGLTWRPEILPKVPIVMGVCSLVEQTIILAFRWLLTRRGSK